MSDKSLEDLIKTVARKKKAASTTTADTTSVYKLDPAMWDALSRHIDQIQASFGEAYDRLAEERSLLSQERQNIAKTASDLKTLHYKLQTISQQLEHKVEEARPGILARMADAAMGAIIALTLAWLFLTFSAPLFTWLRRLPVWVQNTWPF